MLNKIIKFSLYNRLVVIIVSGLLLIGGTFFMLNSEVDIFPDLNAPTVTIMTEAPGMAAEEVEQLVTYPIESAVTGAINVESVRSSSTTGFSVVTIQFTDNADPMEARQIVSERLNIIASDLPANVDAPVIGPQSSILGEVLIIGLTSDSLSQEQLRTIADTRLRKAIQGVEGVSSVSVIGGEEKEYRVTLDQNKMRNFGITLSEVTDALTAVNNNATGGILNGFGNEYTVKADVSTTSTDDIAKTVIRADNSGIIALSDIGRVEIRPKEPIIGVASINRQPAVLLTVTKQPSTGTISLTERIFSIINNMRPSLPPSLNISTDIFRQSDFIETSVSNLSDSLFEGAIMVIIVLFFFMMNLRATTISLLALPLSIIITILILHLLGVTINTMTLGGIAIAIGSLVDDAIVDVENVYKRLRENLALPADLRKSTLKVIYDASREVRTPIFNSTLIIIAGFLPLFFLTGLEGRLLAPLGLAFIVALAASTIVALSVTPVVCSLLSGSKRSEKRLAREPKLMTVLKNFYNRCLKRSNAHPKIIYSITGVLFLFAIILFFNIGKGFLPAFNEGSFTINVNALPGITIEESNRIGDRAEQLILSVPEIKLTSRKTGRAELDEHSLPTGTSEIEAPYILTNRSRSEVAAELRHKLSELPGVSVEIGQPVSHRIDAMLSGTEAPIAIKIFGDDHEMLYSLAEQIKNKISRIPGIEDAATEQLINRPEIVIRPNRSMMARYGITPAIFNTLVTTTLAGSIVSQVYENGYPRDLTLKIDVEGADKIESLRNLTIDSYNGKIPLSEIAEVISTESPTSFNRENSMRRIVVSAQTEGRDLSSIVEDINSVIASTDLPEGYRVEIGGRAETAKKSTNILILTSLLSLLIVFFLLYKQFNRLSDSLLILIDMPLAIIGGVLALWISGLEIDLPAIIGFIALIGISTRNGMLLLARYRALINEGYDVNEAVAKGSADRLSPILMTALTSALALIPIALRYGQPGNEIQSPLAVVIIGGLISSTLLNLFILPSLFLLINRNKVVKTNETSVLE